MAATEEADQAVKLYESSLSLFSHDVELTKRRRSFDDFVGHTTAIETLKAHVLSRKSRAVIIEGKSGVGKTTLAWAYARALVCEAPTRDGSACERCSNCKQFPSSLGFYTIYADLLNSTSAKEPARIRGLLSDLRSDMRYGTLANRPVMIVEGLEFTETSFFDSLLKALEELSTGIVVIFLVEDINRLHGAIRSRCERIPLYPLSFDEAQELCVRLCTELALNVGLEELNVLCALSRGNPGRLRELMLNTIASQSEGRSFEDALNLNWGSDLLTTWTSAFLKMEGLGFVREALPVITEEGLETLAALYLFRDDKRRAQAIVHPAFGDATKNALENASAALQRAALRWGLSSQGALYEIIRLAVEEPVVEGAG